MSTCENHLLLVGRNNRVSLVRNGKIVRQKTFDAPIVAVCADTQRRQFFLGDNLDRVYRVDTQLDVHKILTLPGGITGLAVLDNGRLVVCYGLSAYGPDYYITILEQDPDAAIGQGLRTGFCTFLLAANGENAIYSTVNSRLGMVASDGQKLWERVLPQRPLGIAVSSDAGTVIAASDRRGGLTLLDGQGHVLWHRQPSRFALNRVAFSPDEEMILSCDDHGRIFIHSRQGRLLYRDATSANRSALTAFVRNGSDMLALDSEGATYRISMAAASSLRWVADFRIFRILCNVVLAVGLFASAIGSSRYLSGRAARFLKKLCTDRGAYFLLIPTLGLLCIFNYYPVVTAFAYSFTSFSLNGPVEFIGLQNFRRMLSDYYVWVGVKNMFIFLAAGLFKTLTMPFLVAELVFWLSGNRLKRFFRTAFVIPAVVPGLVFVLLWTRIYDPYNGLINNLLTTIGLEEYTHAWLAEEGFALGAIICAGFPWIDVFAFLILLGGLINIDKDVHEAADLDGIGTWKRFWKIDLPLVLPQIKLLIVFVFIGSIQDFTNVLIFTNGGPGVSTYVPTLHMFKQISEGANLGYASSIGLVLFALVLTATIINLKFIKTHDYGSS